ncbi:MAG: hypothetical protein KGH88_09265, partial [Thaumarchaeota archaeon]|nr:hypothetical protein [Nitrososphaerota archaeon]
MVSNQFITIISIIIPSVIIFLLSSQGPIMKPYFTADINDETGNSTLLIIKNVGWAQAKNASAYIEADHVLTIKKNECFEGSLDTTNPSTSYVIHFKRMSSAISCKIDFTGSDMYDFTTIIV